VTADALNAPAVAAALELYHGALLVLALYGLHRIVLMWRYLRGRGRRMDERAADAYRPFVTVQLPLYNEANVAARLIESVGRLRYPSDRLEIQVLDDSTDETTSITETGAARLRARGLDALVIRRPSRAGFKAGALSEGLARAKGEILLILDADFVPPPDLLERTVGHFADPRVGAVQTRWGHLNRERSGLTRTQALMLDGHFVVEHTGRSLAGCFFNFNGSAGLWRREAIAGAGGWQSDTLTEDLDLSYRAQLAGWRFVYRPDVVVPGELPESITAFKSQQHRWARGGMQTLRKLIAPILRAQIPLRIKIEAIFHLTSNVTYPMVVLLAILLPVAVWRPERNSAASIPELLVVALGTLGLTVFYTVAGATLETRGWRRGLRGVPRLLALGVGMSVSQSHALIAGLAGGRGEFARTPKRGGAPAVAKPYAARPPRVAWLEIALALYTAATGAAAALSGVFALLPLAFLYAAGFGWVGASSALSRRQPRVAKLIAAPGPPRFFIRS
jgi:cellulose synthase/poly-beta-1,6-N-acetylglucosamine synthase-like glycosyltransferase